MAGKRLTDRHFKELYFGLLRHYQSLKNQNITNPWQIQAELKNHIQSLLQFDSRYNASSGLTRAEADTMFRFADIFFNATPDGQILRGSSRPVYAQPVPPQPTTIVVNEYYKDRGLNWFVFIDNTSTGLYTPPPVSPPGSSTNSGNTTNTKDQNNISVLAGLGTLAVIFGGAIATWYLLKEISHNLERFIYNEGLLQATISLLALGAISYASSYLIFVYAALPVTNFLLSAGLVDLASAAIVSLSAIGAGVGTFAFDMLHRSIIKNTNAIDPLDPNRYAPSESDEDHLLQNNIDPLAVKMAIIALRNAMAEEQPLYRIFSNRTKIVKNNLTLIRNLRDGHVGEAELDVSVGDMKFDCRSYGFQPAQSQAYASPVYYQPSAPPPYSGEAQSVGPVPSAPSYY